MCLCDHSVLTSISMRQVITSSHLFYMDSSRKTAFFEGWSWFKSNNLGLVLGTNLKFYTSVGKGLELKVRNFGGLVPMSVEVTGKKLVGGFFVFPLPPILNRVKIDFQSSSSPSSNKVSIWFICKINNFISKCYRYITICLACSFLF